MTGARLSFECFRVRWRCVAANRTLGAADRRRFGSCRRPMGYPLTGREARSAQCSNSRNRTPMPPHPVLAVPVLTTGISDPRVV